MSDEHKAALAEGRNLGRAVRGYLEALDARTPKPGRPRTIESVTARLRTVEERIETADAIGRLTLIQQRIELTNQLADLAAEDDMAELEAGFVASAKRYSELKGISYQAWREFGVPASVLKAAGIARTR